MSTPARIDELRKKFDENPRRYFAPLANEYRKAGDLPQAIALCREHLPKQPGHMSGHIVYGQALYEASELGEARTVFESALALDPENLIALRHLGDIAKAGGDASAARRWYERVLDADPRNDDIAAQLATLGTASATPAAAMPSVRAPFTPQTNTPAPDAAYGPLSPTPAFGMGALPTPDAAMRAVDFDVVNAEIARYTPLGIDAIESSVSAEPPRREPEARPTFEPLDLDAMEAIGEPQATDEAPESSAEVEHAHAVAAELEPTETTDSHVADEYSDTQADMEADVEDHCPRAEAVDVEEVLNELEPVEIAHAGEQVQASDEALDDPFTSSEPVADGSGVVDFEEGIFAPEWPADTADIIASIATPRTVTPLYVSVTPEQAVAFGREPHEVPAEQVDEEPTRSSEPAMSSEQSIPSEPDTPVVHAAHGDDHVAAEIELTENEASEREPAKEEASVEYAAGEDTTAHDATAEHPIEDAETDEASFADVAVEASADADDETEQATAHAPDPMPGFATETMGELLVAQGFIERAADVYEELVRRRPYDPVLTSRLAELRERLAADTAPAHAAAERTTPLRNTPLRNTPLRSTPLRSTPVHSTPVRNTPLWNTPLRSTPLHGTPARATPYDATTAIDPFAQDDDETSSLTSRELFARIAARRVPRRTPPHTSPAVTHDSADGLASLFGGTGPSHDDAAAQALADAFAPISAQEMATGAGLDLDFGATDASRPSPVSTGTVSFETERSGASALHSNAPATPASNAGFSFDRFFPDPARPQGGRAEAVPADPSLPGGSTASASPSGEQASAPGKTTEDLAQFSAWLKGLGGS